MEQFDKVKSCLNCPDRVIGCHGNCEYYAMRTEAQKKINAKRRKDISTNRALIEMRGAFDKFQRHQDKCK